MGIYHVDTATARLMHRPDEDTVHFVFQRKDATDHFHPEVGEHMNKHRNGYGWAVVPRKLIWCCWPPRSPDLFLLGYLRNVVFIRKPPTDVPILDGSIIEAVSSVIRDLLTKVCEETRYRTDSCRESPGAWHPRAVELRGKFHRFFNDLRLSSIIKVILISINFENI